MALANLLAAAQVGLLLWVLQSFAEGRDCCEQNKPMLLSADRELCTALQAVRSCYLHF